MRAVAMVAAVQVMAVRTRVPLLWLLRTEVAIMVGSYYSRNEKNGNDDKI